MIIPMTMHILMPVIMHDILHIINNMKKNQHIIIMKIMIMPHIKE